jgi:hypothetical protein
VDDKPTLSHHLNAHPPTTRLMHVFSLGDASTQRLALYWTKMLFFTGKYFSRSVTVENVYSRSQPGTMREGLHAGSRYRPE